MILSENQSHIKRPKTKASIRSRNAKELLTKHKISSIKDDATKMLTLNEYFSSKNDPFQVQATFYKTASSKNLDTNNHQRKTTTPNVMYRNFIKNTNMHINLINQDNGFWTQRTINKMGSSEFQSDKRAKTSQNNLRKNLPLQPKINSIIENNQNIKSKLLSKMAAPLGSINKNISKRMVSTPRAMTSRSKNRRSVLRDDDRAKNRDFFQTLRSEW